MALTSTEEAQLRALIDQQAAILSLASSESTIISKLGATKVTIADLASASTIGDTDLFIIRQGTSEKNVTGAVIKAIATASVSAATTTTAGVVELATDSETQTGTDPDRAVTPASLTSRTATETRTGLVELATDAEAQAFTANKFIDGAKLESALKGANQSLSASGYQKLPGGLIIQWGTGTVASTSSVSVTFPISFPLAMINANTETRSQNETIYPSANTLSGMTISNSGGLQSNFYWIAIGY